MTRPSNQVRFRDIAVIRSIADDMAQQAIEGRQDDTWVKDHYRSDRGTVWSVNPGPTPHSKAIR